MRTIGNIERFLVIGIVVVIGAILAVAIKGADDLEGAYKKQTLAKASEGKKGGGTSLSKVDPLRGSSGPVAPTPAKGDVKGESADHGALGTDPADLSKRMQKILNGDKPGDAGHADPTAGGTLEKPDSAANGAKGAAATGTDPNGSATKPESDPPVPFVIKDDPKEANDSVGGQHGAGKPIGDPATGGTKGGEATPAVLDWTYEVQPGDRLERIASTLYGDRSMWKNILAVNPAYTDPTRIRAGTVLALPKAPTNTTATGLAHGATKAQPAALADEPHDAKVSDGGHAAATTKPAADEVKATTYKRVTNTDQYGVQKGDTLMAIAAAHYGTRAAWRMILGANTERITDKDHIKPGTVLKLPAQ